ncbi:MAG: XisI protein [Phaeodactylibacter sp.]|nr:XisI protein [Phaeodactylibacter sp.]
MKKALEKEGWYVTDDPLIIFIKEDNVAIDLAAEKLLVAERSTPKIAIEVKSFAQPSLFYAFHEALGQYINYETALAESGDNRQLYLAVSSSVYENLMSNYIIKKSVERCKLRMIIVDLVVEEGIPKSDIVLGYFPSDHRAITEFAAA